MLGANKGKEIWSKIVAVRFSDNISLEIKFQNILSVKIFEKLVNLVGPKIELKKL